MSEKKSTRDQALEILRELYTYCVEEGHSRGGYNLKKWDAMAIEERNSIIRACEYLKENGWADIDFHQLKCPSIMVLTPQGIDLIEGTATTPQQPVQNVFNVAENRGVVAAQASNFNLHQGIDLKELGRLLDDRIADQQDRQKILTALNQLQDKLKANEPLEKGVLSSISSHLEEHSWLSGAVASWLLQYVANLRP